SGVHFHLVNACNELQKNCLCQPRNNSSIATVVSSRISPSYVWREGANYAPERRSCYRPWDWQAERRLCFSNNSTIAQACEAAARRRPSRSAALLLPASLLGSGPAKRRG